MSTSAPQPVAADAPVAPNPPGHLGLSIQSILLIMFLGVALLSTVVVGLIGYTNGTDSLRHAAFDRLVEVRDSRAREVTNLFTGIENSVKLQSRDSSTIEATQAFSAGFDALGSATLSATEATALDGYFATSFAPRLEKASGGTVDPKSLVPKTAAARYLQSHYTVPFATEAAAAATGNAGDGSAWSAANGEYQSDLQRIAKVRGYGDLLLLDTRGDVVYSVNKGIDLGTNLRTGPYASTGLAAAFGSAMSSNILDTAVFTDLEKYTPALTAPVGWAVTPVGSGGTIVGALAVRLPTTAIDAVMTNSRSWDTSVLGKTGETYLVGSDQMMRSESRELVQAPTEYIDKAVASGTSRASAKRAVAAGTSVLVQPVQTDAVDAALAGKTGTLVGTSYLGEESLAAYAPLEVEGLHWVIVAEIDSGEAFAPVAEFTRNLVLSSLAVFVLVALLSLLLAQFIIRPLKRLKVAAGRIASGEEGVVVDAGTSDELADVGRAFNEMSRSLQLKATLLEQQEAENERLLLTLMPEAIAKRYRGGDQSIVEDHKEVSVLYADIVGFDEYSRGLSSTEALASLNELLRTFDEAAEEHGVERVRTTRKGYLASCGLTIPRVDNARRTVDFSIEMQNILDRWGSQRGVTLKLRAGIDTGLVTSGLVGNSHIIYDLWGDAVNLAFSVQAETAEAGIFVTQAVADKLPETIEVVDAGTVKTTEGETKVWRIDSTDDHA